MNNLLFRHLKVLLFLLFLVASFAGMSQQPLVYNQFFMNPYVYNPAYAGVEGHSVLFLMYKNQYSNIDGAPKTYHANFHVPLRGGIAFGASAHNESHGVLNTVSGKVTGGYLLSIDREHLGIWRRLAHVGLLFRQIKKSKDENAHDYLKRGIDLYSIHDLSNAADDENLSEVVEEGRPDKQGRRMVQVG